MTHTASIRTNLVICKACEDTLTVGKAVCIANYGLICPACLVILKAGGDPSQGDRLHKRVDLATLTYTDPLAPIRAWWALEQATLAARPAEATCACGACGDTYARAGLKALDSDAVYERAVEHESLGDRDVLLCRFCRERLEAEYGTEADRDEDCEEEWALARAGVLPASLLAKRLPSHEDIEADASYARDLRDEGRGIFY